MESNADISTVKTAAFAEGVESNRGKFGIGISLGLLAFAITLDATVAARGSTVSWLLGVDSSLVHDCDLDLQQHGERTALLASALEFKLHFYIFPEASNVGSLMNLIHSAAAGGVHYHSYWPRHASMP